MYFSGFDVDHHLSNIRIKDYSVNGKKVTNLATIGKNGFVGEVTIE